MPIIQEFEYFKPTSISEVINLLQKYGNKASILAGGTDLIVRIQDGFDNPEIVIDIKEIQELKRLEFKSEKLFIGAAVTFSELLDSSIVKNKFPLIWEAALSVGSVPVRNRATMVGNICSCVPSMDSAPALLVYEAEILVRGNAGERKISVFDWFKGPRKTDLIEGEIVVGIFVPLPEKKPGGCYVKLKRYQGEDLAQVGVAILVFENNNYRISFGSVGPIPTRAKRIEKILKGKKLTDKNIEAAKKLVADEISPITDIRASKEYRMHIAKIMLERGLIAAVERMNGKGPKLGISVI